MPKFLDPGEGLEVHNIGNGFKFTATSIDKLGATEYTLGTLVIDGSGSVITYWDQIKQATKRAIKQCRRHPRADNMMMRVLIFDHDLHEFHGFKPLQDCNENDYDNMPIPGNTTALYDATFNGVEASAQYGKQLVANQYAVNAVLFVITDGMDNASKTSRKMVKDSMAAAKHSESLESINPILIGVGTGSDIGSSLNSWLQDFKDEAGFQQYIGIDEATGANGEAAFKKLDGFISKSMSSSSQALGTGKPSQSLAF